MTPNSDEASSDLDEAKDPRSSCSLSGSLSVETHDLGTLSPAELSLLRPTTWVLSLRLLSLSPSQTPVSSAPILSTPASHLIQVTSKPKPQIPLDECSYCHQKGHWKYSCPNRGQSKGQKGFSQSSSSSRASQQYSQHGTQLHSRSSTALAAPTSNDTSLLPSFAVFQQFQQYRAFMATIQGDYTHASAMTTTHSDLHSSSPITAPIAKEDLIYLDPFPSDMSTEEYSSTLDIVDISFPTTSPKVSNCPPPPATSSLPSLIPPAPLVYSRRRAASPIPSSSSMAPSSDSGNPDLPIRRYPARSRHPPPNYQERPLPYTKM
ncbi:hypothetical protein Acr_05g0000810 [Actinidia rufa]|uniref:Uncharacterized protein n=1 Tax=Actinidia rufa TaxID=165716 RepID=A0A7J0EJH1_9ERIC|nr:hypothetical protein Acr_05g0000810 [Actinidia rufa]